MEKLSRLIWLSDHYPMPLIHKGTNDTTRYDSEQISSDYKALGEKVKELGAQVVSLPALLIKGKGPGGDKCILEMNAWLTDVLTGELWLPEPWDAVR